MACPGPGVLWGVMGANQPANTDISFPRSGSNDTAIECGWSNATSFIEAFTAVVGQTPGALPG